ncbi:hypothetical protein [Oligoflexus tunisiensis]|uniref:hypothetical protein n=1 Tax=Oligoflexus tunisiensis TaxID=708132 RepID=UPI00114CB210|nr:hypothetical protein [Oligoflexus tunisiensis]
MAQGIILIIMSLSLVTAGMSARALILEWRKAHRQLYGTMNFDGRATRGSKVQMLTNVIVCLVSLVLLACSLMIYQFIHFPVL